MRVSLIVAVAGCSTLVACAGSPPVALTPRADASLSRWNAVIGTPEALRGVVQTRGNASMTSTDNGRKTRVAVTLENAVPRGRHPWVLRTGQCGGMGTELFRSKDDRRLSVDDDGKARAELDVDLSYPAEGDYTIAILAAAENQEQVLACGNFAPPVNR
jgi:hypothetical protein